MAAHNKVFVLSESAYQQSTDFDVVMLYQVLLGRNPENSTVIQNHRLNPFNITLQGFINSPEFRESVLEPPHRRRPGAPPRLHRPPVGRPAQLAVRPHPAR